MDVYLYMLLTYAGNTYIAYKTEFAVESRKWKGTGMSSCVLMAFNFILVGLRERGRNEHRTQAVSHGSVSNEHRD